MSSYSCWLYGSITTRSPVFPFKDFSDIIEDGSYTVGIVEGYSAQQEIQVPCFIKNLYLKYGDNTDFIKFKTGIVFFIIL